MGKRARLVRSSSLGDGSALDHLMRPPPTALRPPPRKNSSSKLPPPPVEIVGGAAGEERTQKSVLTLGSPCRDAPPPLSVGFGEFFRSCFSCKKPITEKDAVFMYGVLLAFCSTQCRNKQMKLDLEAANMATRASKVKTSGINRKFDSKKSQWGSQY